MLTNCSKDKEMNVKTQKFSLLVILTFSVSLLMSCVGTIKDANPLSTKAASTNDKAMSNYGGISAATAISNTRVEVVFPPADGDADQLAYVIRYDGQQIPTYVYGSSLKPDYRGLLKHTILNLQSDSLYAFSVQVRNIKTNVESSNNISKVTKTFNNATAIFNGISVARNLPGADGLNGIEVIWAEAEIRGGVVSKDEVDPIEYQVTVIDASSLNPGDMNDTNFSDPVRKIYSIQGNKRSATINGLKAGTKYFVQVRAVHYGYSIPANSSNINYKKEVNTNYLEISTYSDDLGNLNFDNGSLVTAFPPGIAGLYATQLDWESPEGNFDHYRIYYSIDGTSNVSSFLNSGMLDPACSGTETSDSNINCQFVDSNVSSFLLTGLETNTKYNMALAVCLSRTCENGKRIVSNIKTHTTTPPVASFRGISSIDAAKDINKLDRMFLNFESPDFTSGNISGFVVDYYGIDITNPSPMSLNDSDVLNTTLLTVQPFDFRNDTTIEISGIDPSSSTPYCFLIVPFTYNNDGSKTLHKTGLIPQCKVPQIKGPTLLEFAGIDSHACSPLSREISLTWIKPLSGIYDSFELFYTVNAGSFNFGEAFDWINNPTYHRIQLLPSKTGATLSNLQPGKTYRVGVISFYDSINGPIRSEINNNTIQCNL